VKKNYLTKVIRFATHNKQKQL